MTLPAPRTTDQVQDGLVSLFPPGWAAGNQPGDYEVALYRPIAAEIGTIEASMYAMLPQIDPRGAAQLLPDWERMLGIPNDPCLAANPITDTVTRGLLAYERLTNAGTICAGYFENLALQLGETITITEAAAYCCSDYECAAAELVVPPENCSFLVTLPATGVTNFECGVSTCDDSLGLFNRGIMECIISNGAPLYATPYFSYV